MSAKVIKVVTYNCEITNTDTMRVHVTGQERAYEDLLAFVLEDMDNKISVLLSKADAVTLKTQIDEFVEDY